MMEVVRSESGEREKTGRVLEPGSEGSRLFSSRAFDRGDPRNRKRKVQGGFRMPSWTWRPAQPLR